MPTIYKGKPIEEFTDWELRQANAKFAAAEEIREKASKHLKFDKVNNNKAICFFFISIAVNFLFYQDIRIRYIIPRIIH